MYRVLRSLPTSTVRQARNIWYRYGIFWLGAIAVGLVAVMYARLIDWGYNDFRALQHQHVWLPLLLTPAVAAVSVGLTRKFFRGSEGSGIPQVIAVLHSPPGLGAPVVVARHSLREDRHLVSCDSRRLHDRPRRPDRAGRRGNDVPPATPVSALERAHRTAACAGGRGGGIVGGIQIRLLRGLCSAIEELMRSFEARTSGVLITAIILAGIRRAGSEWQLHVFRHDRDRLAFSQSAGGRGSADGGRDGARGRGILLAAAQHREVDPCPIAHDARAAARRVRSAVRAGHRGDRTHFRRHDLWQRLCRSARPARRTQQLSPAYPFLS